MTEPNATQDPATLMQLAEKVTAFAQEVNELFGEACAGEVLLAMSIDHLAGEGKTIHDIHSLSTGCYERCLRVMEGLGQTVPETQRHMGIQGDATAGRRVSGEVQSGASYLSQNDARLHFGLAGDAAYDRIDVTWPGGGKETFPGGPANRIVTLVQGRGAPPEGR